jgi:hypothetical protein
VRASGWCPQGIQVGNKVVSRHGGEQKSGFRWSTVADQCCVAAEPLAIPQQHARRSSPPALAARSPESSAEQRYKRCRREFPGLRLYLAGGPPWSRSASSRAPTVVSAPHWGSGNTTDSLQCAYGSSFQAALDDTGVSSPWSQALCDNYRRPWGSVPVYYHHFFGRLLKLPRTL